MEIRQIIQNKFYKILNKFPFRAEKRTVVVEIGMDWLKVGEVEVSNAKRKITKMGIRRLTSSIKKNLAQNIVDILKSLKIQSDTVITYLPRHLATIRILELPTTDKDEVADMVELQTIEQTPYSKEEIVTNFKILESNREGYTKIMLVIVRKSVIVERLKLFQDAGLKIQFIGLSSEMSFNLSQQLLSNKHLTEEDTVIGFIDMDLNFTDFLFVYNDVLFTRGIFVGRENILAEPEVWKDKFVNQIKNSIEIYKHQGFTKNVGKIVINRVAAEIENLQELLKQTLNLPVEVLDILDDIPLSEDALRVAKEYNKKTSLLAFFGSLLNNRESEINLMPKELRMKDIIEERSKQIIISGILLFSILVVISGILVEKIYNKSCLLNILKQQVLKTDKNASYVEEMKLKIDMIKSCLDKRYSVINCLNQLYKVVPDEIYFNSIAYEHGRELILTGSSDAMSVVFEFVTLLESLEHFEKIKTNYVTKKRRKGKEVVDFELVCPIAR